MEDPYAFNFPTTWKILTYEIKRFDLIDRLALDRSTFTSLKTRLPWGLLQRVAIR